VRMAPKGRKSVVLFDEVDIFAGDIIYGKPYRPCVDLDHEAGLSLIQFVWDSRGVIWSVDTLMKDPKVVDAVARLRSRFLHFSDEMLARFVRKQVSSAIRKSPYQYVLNGIDI